MKLKGGSSGRYWWGTMEDIRMPDGRAGVSICFSKLGLAWFACLGIVDQIKGWLFGKKRGHAE